VSLAEDDRLGIARYVRSFARLIAARGVEAPLALGVFGAWGSGKSFFMRALDGEVQALAAEAGRLRRAARDGAPGRDVLAAAGPAMWHDRIVPIWFNAWHYVDRNLWASLALRVFDTLSGALGSIAPDSPGEQLRLGAASTAEVKRDAEERRKAAEALRGEAEQRLAELKAERRKAEHTLLDDTVPRLSGTAADGGAIDGEALLEQTRTALREVGLGEMAGTLESLHRVRDRLIEATWSR
jgi:hypothetical protein